MALVAMQGSVALWAAQDARGMAGAAVELIERLVPGSHASLVAESSESEFQVSLSDHQRLTALLPAGARDEDRTVLAAVMQLVEIRVHDLTDKARLERAVERFSSFAGLQVSLFHIAEQAAITGALGDFYVAIHRAVRESLDARNLYVALLSESGTRLTFPYYVSEVGKRAAPCRLGHGMTAYVLRKACPVRVDADALAILNATGEIEYQYPGAVSWLGVPLICDARVVGVLAVQSYEPTRRYDAYDQDMLSLVACHIASTLARVRATTLLREMRGRLETDVDRRMRKLSLANRRLRAEVGRHQRIAAHFAHAASHDALTDLPNQAYFRERLAQAFCRYRRDRRQEFAVLFVDLDHFKVVNDAEGHAAGNDVLMQAAARLRASVKGSDIVARLGGDEFGILLEEVGSRTLSRSIAERVVTALRAPFGVAGKKGMRVLISASIGVAVADACYPEPGALLRDADAAMYRAKAEGRNRYVVSNPSIAPLERESAAVPTRQ